MKITDLNTKKKFIAFRIRAILQEKDWTQQQLADAMGVNKSYVSKVLTGEQNLTLEGISSIEQALSVPILDVDITPLEKKEYTEEVVLSEFLKVSGLPISSFTRGKRIDFVAKQSTKKTEVKVGIDLQSYQHSATAKRRMEFRQELVNMAQKKFAETNNSMLGIQFHFHDGFPSNKKMSKSEKEKLVNKIVKYVNKYAHNYERENNSLMAMRLYEFELDTIFYAISIYDGFKEAMWMASHDAWFPLSLNDVVDEVERRVKDKNTKVKGYRENDSCDEYWLLMYYDGDSISGINLGDGIGIEEKHRLDEIARASPFTKIYIFDPYWAVHTIRYYAIKG